MSVICGNYGGDMDKKDSNKEVLAMYDIRGIQNYIFKSNVAKEIIGASAIVDNIIINGLEEYKNTRVEKDKQKYYMTDWKSEYDDAKAFIKDDAIQMQVMFIGGGNAYVLFREREICKKVNRFLGKYVLKNTYSLNLSVAVVEKTESYEDDYKNINKEMRKIKSYMPLTQPLGALPFMMADSITGYPITHIEKDQYSEKTEKYCTESYLKKEAFYHLPKREDEKLFDNMVTQKGDNSILAVCHIDGNSMGVRIINTMKNKKSYKDAIPAIRELSKEIANTFENTYKSMEDYMKEISSQVKAGSDNNLYRKIIVAGDDITFVCNAKLAIPAVKYFLQNLGTEYSACGGIAFFNSHFPFSDAYKAAEACCDSAKKRAKLAGNRDKDGKIGSYLDYQVCNNISAAQLDRYREKNYSTDMGSIIYRPYYVSVEGKKELNEKNKQYDISKLYECLKYLDINNKNDINKLPRSKAKQLRDAICIGENEIKSCIALLESRGYKYVWKVKDEYAIWYDALEIMDLLIIGDAEK